MLLSTHLQQLSELFPDVGGIVCVIVSNHGHHEMKFAYTRIEAGVIFNEIVNGKVAAP